MILSRAAFTATTPNAGPCDWTSTANWSLNAVPVSTDDVYIGPTACILFGIDQNTITPASFTVSKSAIVGLGLDSFLLSYVAASRSVTVTTTASEYRDDFLRLATVKLTVTDDGTPVASNALVKIDTVTANCATVIYGAADRSDGRASLRLEGTNSGSTVESFGGFCEISMEEPADTGQLATVGIYSPNARVSCGIGLTLATLNLIEGFAYVRKCPTTITNEAGSNLRIDATTGTVSTWNNRGANDTRGANFTVTAMKG
jgi:hypothetical protein